MDKEIILPIVVAVLAGWFSFITLIISKENKTSEFRQKWIDSLRKEISDFLTSVNYLKISIPQGATKPGPEFSKDFEKNINKYFRSYALILLRINPNEKNKKREEITKNFINIYFRENQQCRLHRSSRT